MRELKFRAWSKATSHYYDVESLKADGSIVARYIANGKVNYLALPAEEIVVEQYTGLKDKNDKEIYEGDILKVIDIDYAEKSWVCVVEYDENYAHFYCDTHYGECWTFEELEVIGNIHKNPELLEKK